MGEFHKNAESNWKYNLAVTANLCFQSHSATLLISLPPLQPYSCRARHPLSTKPETKKRRFCGLCPHIVAVSSKRRHQLAASCRFLRGDSNITNLHAYRRFQSTWRHDSVRKPWLPRCQIVSALSQTHGDVIEGNVPSSASSLGSYIFGRI